ncbi:MAG: ArgS-related anticodon-binding protein NrtL, partial [Streptomyces sp.]
MTPAQLSRTVLHTVRRAVESGELGDVPAGAVPEPVVVESPPRRGAGDYAVSVAFPLAKAAGMPPLDVARVLQAGLGRQDGIRSVEIAGGGFLNVTLDDRAGAALVTELSDAGQEYEPG